MKSIDTFPSDAARAFYVLVSSVMNRQQIIGNMTPNHREIMVKYCDNYFNTHKHEISKAQFVDQ